MTNDREAVIEGLLLDSDHLVDNSDRSMYLGSNIVFKKIIDGSLSTRAWNYAMINTDGSIAIKD